MFDDVTSVALKSALDGLATRQRTTSDNIANINTPHFIAGRVQFEDALRDAVSTGDPTQVADVQATQLPSLEPTQENGNNVNLDEETLSQTETGMSYSLMLRAVDDRFTLLKTAIGK